jgi:hypothetical protein
MSQQKTKQRAVEKRSVAQAGSSTAVVRLEHPDMALQFKIMDVRDAFEFEEAFAVFESQPHFSSYSYTCSSRTSLINNTPN